MKIAIIGPGAMGCLFAAYLKQGGLDVRLIDHNPQRARELTEKGIQIEGIRGPLQVQVPISCQIPAGQPVDLVIVCVKAFSTRAALEQHGALIGADTLLLSLQNGIGNTDTMADILGPDKVLAGTTTLGANQIEPGRIHHAGDGDTYIGELSGGAQARTHHIANMLSAASIQVQVSDDVQTLIWKKLVINVGINALTALLGVHNGVLIEHASSRTIMRQAVTEAIQVAQGQQIQLELEATLEQVHQVAKRTAKNRSSMLADMLAGKKTEIDAINGAICRLGRAPVNHTLTQLVHAMEATTRQRISPMSI